MSPALQLALLLAILLPAGKLAASLCSRFAIPAILGELLVGVLLGPGAVNLLHMHVFAGGEASSALMLLAQFGGFVLMFIAGIETDIDRMREASGAAFLVALSGVIWPFFLGAGVGHLFGLSWKTACFLGGALTATSANPSHAAPARDAPALQEYFGDAIDLIVDGGEATSDQPSTVVDVTTEKPKLIREGVIRWAQIHQAI